MRLRTQLILATFLLAIVPLTAIVLYSYRSSRHALENAYRREAARMMKQMDTRLASIRNELETRLAGVSRVPLQSLPQDVARAMGDVAPLVHSVEFQPVETSVARPPVPPEPIVVDVPSVQEISAMSMEMATQGANMTDEQRAVRARASPLGTEGTAWDIGWAAVYLASDEARWVTGQTLIIDAGLTMTTPEGSLGGEPQ